MRINHSVTIDLSSTVFPALASSSWLAALLYLERREVFGISATHTQSHTHTHWWPLLKLKQLKAFTASCDCLNSVCFRHSLPISFMQTTNAKAQHILSRWSSSTCVCFLFPVFQTYFHLWIILRHSPTAHFNFIEVYQSPQSLLTSGFQDFIITEERHKPENPCFCFYDQVLNQALKEARVRKILKYFEWWDVP